MNHIQANVLQPNATVTVFLASTSTLATIYADNNRTPLSNPFTADSSGNWSFFAAPGSYDVQFSGSGIPAPFKITGLGNSGVVPAYAVAGLPPSIPSNQGNLAVVTDAGGLWANTGTQWVPVDPFINVKDHGAKGNGVADDTAAIQATLNEANRRGGGTVYLPAGTYNTSSLLGIYSYTAVVGDGPAATTIHQLSDYTAGLQPYDGSHDIIIRDLTIQGSYTHTTYPNGSNAIMSHVTNTTAVAGGDMSDANFAGNRITVQNCTILNWGFNGVGGTAGCKILNNRFINVYNEPIIIAGDDSLIDGNYINGCFSWAIDNNASHTRIIDNLIYNCGQGSQVSAIGGDGGGIIIANVNRTDGMRDIHVEGNTIDTSNTNGILLYPSVDQQLAYVTVSNNILRNCWTDHNSIGIAAPWLRAAITVENAQLFADYPLHHILVSNNVVENTFDKGILTLGTRYIDIIGNNISNIGSDNSTNGGTGIWVYNHGNFEWTDVNVRSNSISNFGGIGLNIAGSTTGPSRVQVVSNTVKAPTTPTANIACLSIANTTDFICNDNFVFGVSPYHGIDIIGGSGNGTVSGNYVEGTAFGINYQPTGGGVSILGNNLRNNTTPMFLGTLSNVFIKNNAGFNPRGPLAFYGGQPAVPATNVAVQNNFGFDCFVSITAPANVAPDGITEIFLTDPSGNQSVLWPNSVGIVQSAHAVVTVFVPALFSITMTYTIAPTWVWFGN